LPGRGRVIADVRSTAVHPSGTRPARPNVAGGSESTGVPLHERDVEVMPMNR